MVYSLAVRSRRLGVTLVAGILAAMPATSQEPGSDIPRIPVPDGLIAAASSERVLSFASGLAAADVPAGFILVFSENRASGGPFVNPLATRDKLLPEAVNVFLASNPAYTVRDALGVVVVQPRAPTLCRAAVRRQVPAISLHGNLDTVLNGVFQSIDPSHPVGPPGVIGEGDPLPEVQFFGLTGTVEEVLNEISRQTPGFVWVIWETADRKAGARVCAFDYFYRRSRLASGWRVPPVR